VIDSQPPNLRPLARFRSSSPWLPLAALTGANLRLLARNRQVMVFNLLVPLLLIVIFGGLFQGSKTNVDIVAPAREARQLGMPHEVARIDQLFGARAPA